MNVPLSRTFYIPPGFAGDEEVAPPPSLNPQQNLVVPRKLLSPSGPTTNSRSSAAPAAIYDKGKMFVLDLATSAQNPNRP